MDRRQFLQNALASGSIFLLSSLCPNPTHAQAVGGTTDRPLLILRFNGAWDTLVATDARTKENLNSFGFSDYEFLSFDERVGARAFQDAQLGMTMKPLFGNLEDLCIINGLLMDLNSNIHETNRDYMSSGNLERTTAFFPFALAQSFPAKSQTRVGYFMEYEPLRDNNYFLKSATKNLTSFSEKTDDAYEDILLDDSSAASMQKNIINQNKREQESILLLNRLIAETEKELSPTKIGYKQAALALAGLGSGYLKMAQVDMVMDPELDTHSSHKAQHLPNLTEAFEYISKVIKFMKATPYKLDPSLKKSLFDVTTVVITSEFARTTYSEGSTGTSHNQYNNSCILFGGSVRGNTLIGESQIYKGSEINVSGQPSLLHASPFNFQTQKALTREQIKALKIENIGMCKTFSDCFDFIYPETIWRTIAAQYGINNLSTISSGPILRGLFKS